MSYQERQTLGHNIHFLDRDQLLGIVKIMQDQTSSDNREIIEFDLKVLTNRKCRELERYVN